MRQKNMLYWKLGKFKSLSGSGSSVWVSLEGDEVRYMAQTKESVKVARTALEAETHEVVQVSDRLSDNLKKAGEKIWRHLIFIWAVVIVSGISYFLVLNKAPITTNQATEEHSPAFSAIPESKDAIPESKELINLLNQIRVAQSKKDIRLFLQAYSPNFPNLDHRRDLMLSIWQRYDYLDTQFQLSDVTIKNNKLILGKVTWVIKARDRQDSSMKIFSKSYQVYFSKDSGKWLIQKFVSDVD
jgi:hypothetical protein